MGKEQYEKAPQLLFTSSFQMGESILQNLLEMWPVKIRKKVASRAMRNIRLRSFASGQRGKEGEWERGRREKY